jgi:hypothetical protein
MSTPEGEILRVRERRRKVVQLRLAGVQFPEIGRRLSGEFGAGAHDFAALARMDWKRAREQSRRELDDSVEELRDVQVERLEMLLSGVWKNALSGDSKSADTAGRLITQICKLKGLEPPTQLQLSTRIEMESTAVAEAVIAAIDSLGFTPEVRMRALEAAQGRLVAIAAAREGAL